MNDRAAAARADADGRAETSSRPSDVLSERLVGLIAAGELEAGQRLPPERELMQRFGLGRSAVREAIAKLASRGLLITRPGFRPIVRKPGYETALEALGRSVGHLLADEDGFWNLFESRIFIEGALARHAAAHARREDIAELREALERNRAAIGDSEAFYATDVAFHGVLYRIPRNPIYPVVHQAYVDWLMSHWRRMERSADVDWVNHAGHAAIFDAILARDPDEAEAALRRHLQVAWEFLRTTLTRSPEGTSDRQVA